MFNELNTLVGNSSHGLTSGDYMVESMLGGTSFTYYVILPATWNSGNVWEANGSPTTLSVSFW